MVSLHAFRRSDGYALLLVLWLTALLTSFTALAFTAARTETRVASGELALLRATTLADSGIWLALQTALTTAGTAGTGMVDNTLRIDGETVTVSTRDLSGRLNINHAPRELWQALLLAVGLPNGEAQQLSARIVDWIDADTESADGLGEVLPYRAAGLGYGPRNAPFTTVDELRRIPGISPSLYARLAPSLTVHGSHTYLNRAAVDADLLARLLEAPGVDAAWQSRFLGSGSGAVLDISSGVELDDAKVSRRAVIELLSTGSARPYRILAWQQEPAEGAL